MAETFKNVRLIDKEGNALYPKTSVNQVSGLEEKLKTVANADDLEALSDKVKTEVEAKLEHAVQESDIEQLKAGLGETVRRTETSGGATVDEMGQFFKSEQTGSLEPVACLSSMPQGILGRLLRPNGGPNDFENVPFKFIDKSWFSENFGADDWSYFGVMMPVPPSSMKVAEVKPGTGVAYDEMIIKYGVKQVKRNGKTMADLLITTKSGREFCIMSCSADPSTTFDYTLDYQTEGLSDVTFIAGQEINYINTLRLIANVVGRGQPYYVNEHAE